MAKKTTKDIVKEILPDMEIVDSSSKPTPGAVRQAAKPGAPMDKLREKYLGPASHEAAADSVADDESDVEVKQVRPKKTPADPADDPGQRTVIISRKKGIIGFQG